MTNKWRIFHRPLNVGIDFAEEIVETCCIFANFGLYDNPNVNQNHCGLSGIAIRDKFADYFISNEGESPWQHKYI